MPKKIIFSLIVGGLLSAATLYMAFRNVPIAELAAYMGSIAYGWLGPTMTLVVLTFVLRAYRWRLILTGTVSLGFWQAFHPMMIGFMMNCVLPGRVGELARPVILKKEHGVPFGTGLATVAAERVLDMIMLIVLFAAVFTTVTSRPDLNVTFAGLHLNSQTLQAAAWTMIRMGAVLSIVLAALAFARTRGWMLRIISSLVDRTRMSGVQRFGRALIAWVESFADGLGMLGHPRRACACLGLTILIWALAALSYYVFAIGCPGIDLSFTQMTTVMVIVCFFIALPSVPGYWGLWEAGGVFALSLFGVAERDAAGFTLVNHAAQLFPVIFIGLICALVTSVNILQLTYGSKTNNTLGIQRSNAREPS